jgi:hypothetical protein
MNFKTVSLLPPAFLLFAIPCIGGILFSQGASFARWSPYMGIAHYVNFHALLLAASGLGLLFVGVLLKNLLARIETLEYEIKRLTTKI